MGWVSLGLGLSVAPSLFEVISAFCCCCCCCSKSNFWVGDCFRLLLSIGGGDIGGEVGGEVNTVEYGGMEVIIDDETAGDITEGVFEVGGELGKK